MTNSWPNTYIDISRQIVEAIKIQSYDKASDLFSQLLNRIEKETFFLEGINNPDDSLGAIFNGMLQALDSRDMILLGDIMEESFILWLKEHIEYTDSIETDRYTLEATSAGSLTLKYKPTGVYMHSNNDPMEHARKLVVHYFDKDKVNYAIYGLGLGYHIKALMEYSQGAANIKVFERDKELIDLVDKLGMLEEYKDKIEIVHDINSASFAKCIEDGSYGVIMHYPSIMRIEDEGEARAIKRFYSVWNGTNEVRHEIAINVNKNIQNCSHNVDELKDEFEGKKVLVVAAGPSLDDNIELLKTKQAEGEKLIAVATVYRRLQEKGIEPDYVTVMDSGKRTYGQMDNVNPAGAGLIVGGAAYWGFAENFQGEKYLALQKENSRTEAEARDHGYNTYKTGGTVTSLAIDVAVRLGAKEIGLVGVDMAYRDGYTHAASSMDRRKVSTEGLIKIKSVDGSDVYTEDRLYSYLKWIEEEISDNPQIRFVNYSKTGAYIKGCARP